MPFSYLDFDLLIRRADGGYRAQVLSSPEGETSADFAAPFSDIELQNFVLRLGRPRRGTRRIGSPEMEAARDLGRRLYDAVFSGDVRACWRSSVSAAEAQNAGLRLRLRIDDTPELNDIPWEYLYNSSLNRFLSLSEYTPLVRYLDLPERIRPLAVDGPLDILVMISSPTDPDYASLDVEAEWSRLNRALVELTESGRVRLKRLSEATLSALQRELRRRQYHIFHFIGHGGFDRQTQGGVLVLPDQAGKVRLVAAEHLATMLYDHRSLRLVVLNACEGSRSSREDPFSGVAQTLVQQRIPAVIAMQFEITDAAAIKFAEEFYTAIADGYPVDAALAAARKGIYAQGNDIEWGTPVLYLRAPDGQLFSVNRDAEAVRLAEAEKHGAETVGLAEGERRHAEAEEEKQRAEAARQVEEERRRAEAARQAQEKRQWAEAARQVEEERRRAEAARQAEEERQRAEAARQAEEKKRRSGVSKIGQSVWPLMRWVFFAVALFMLWGSLVIDRMHHSDDETFLVIGLLLAIAVGPYSTVMWWRIGAMVRGANRVPAPTDARAYPATSRAEPKPGLGASREGLVAKNSVTVGWKFLPFWGKIGFLVSYFFSWPTRVAWLPSWLKPFILIIWMMCICSVSVAFFVS